MTGQDDWLQRAQKSLPSNWVECTIGDITLPVEKIDPRRQTDREIAYIDISSIDNQANRITEAKSLRLAEAPDRARQVVRGGDVLFSLVRPYLRNIAAVRAEFDGQIASTGFSVLRPAAGIDPSFLFLHAISKQFVDALSGVQYGVSYPAVKDDQVRAQPIDLPPAEEQRRIVDKIETVFAQLDKGDEGIRKVQKLLARYRQAVLKAAVTGELTADWRAQNRQKLGHGRDLLARILQTRRDSSESRSYREPALPEAALQDLPEGWTWASVDQVVAEFGNGLSDKPSIEPNHLPILRISATRAMSVSVEDLRYYPESDRSISEKYWVSGGDLLFTRYNGSRHLVGVCGLFRHSASVLYPDKLIRARPVAVEGLNAEYLEIAWNAGETRRHISAKIKTTSGQQGIAGGDIKAAAFPLPPAEEQELIAERVWEAIGRIQRTLTLCETELARSSSLRQSILKDAFAGRLVPQHPEDEPAAALLARVKADRTSATARGRRGANA